VSHNDSVPVMSHIESSIINRYESGVKIERSRDCSTKRNEICNSRSNCGTPCQNWRGHQASPSWAVTSVSHPGIERWNGNSGRRTMPNAQTHKLHYGLQKETTTALLNGPWFQSLLRLTSFSAKFVQLVEDLPARPPFQVCSTIWAFLSRTTSSYTSLVLRIFPGPRCFCESVIKLIKRWYETCRGGRRVR
jgi:hypothetical protein